MSVVLPAKGDVAIASKAINLSPGLSNNDRRVAGAIVDHFNRRNGRCDPSVQRLSKLLGINRATVLRATAKLTSVECGMFSKCSHGGHSNCASYQPNWERFRALVRHWDASMMGVGQSNSKTLTELPNVANELTGKSQNRSLIGRTHATQTHPTNPLEKPIAAVLGKIGAENRNAYDQIQARTTQREQEVRRQLMKNLQREKEFRHPSHKTAAIEAAKDRIDKSFLMLGTEFYEEYVKYVSPELQEKAAKAEAKRRGAGVYFICDALRSESTCFREPEQSLKQISDS